MIRQGTNILCGFLILIGFNGVFADNSTDKTVQKRILYYINQYRTQHHLEPLKLNTVISKEAKGHSLALSQKKIPFGHGGFSGRIKRIYRSIPACRSGAENVAYYKLDPKRLVAAWLASSGHRRNISGHYNLTGIGIAYDKKAGWAYFTQIFILRR